MGSRVGDHLRRAVPYGLSAALLGLLFWRIGLERLRAILATAELTLLLPGLALGVVFLLLRGLKWHYLARLEAGETGYRTALHSLLVGACAAMVTPGKSGEVLRAVYVPTGDKYRLGGLVLVDRVLDFTAISLLGVAGAAVCVGPPLALALAAIAGIGILCLFCSATLHSLLGRLINRLPAREKLKRITDCLTLLDRRRLAGYLLLSFVTFLILFAEEYLFVLAFQGSCPPIAVLLLPAALITNLIPLTVGGLGVREGATMWLLSFVEVPHEAAVSASLLLFLTNNLLCVLGSAWLSTKRGAEHFP